MITRYYAMFVHNSAVASGWPSFILRLFSVLTVMQYRQLSWWRDGSFFCDHFDRCPKDSSPFHGILTLRWAIVYYVHIYKYESILLIVISVVHLCYFLFCSNSCLVHVCCSVYLYNILFDAMCLHTCN